MRNARNGNALAFKSKYIRKGMPQLSRFCDKIPNQQPGTIITCPIESDYTTKYRQQANQIVIYNIYIIEIFAQTVNTF